MDLAWGKKASGKYVEFYACPALDMLKSADGVFCNGATCTVNCKPGHAPQGHTRTSCKKSKSRGIVWSNELTGCVTCEDREPVFTDENIHSFCYINSETNEKSCALRYGKLYYSIPSSFFLLHDVIQ